MFNYVQQCLCDPMCGSGTIAIEAALIAANVAPGLIAYSRLEFMCTVYFEPLFKSYVCVNVEDSPVTITLNL